MYKPTPIYIVQEKMQSYPFIWINKFVYKRKKCAVKKYISIITDIKNDSENFRIVRRVMF